MDKLPPLSEPTDEPIGFTAFATVTRNYDDEDIVLFDGIASNVGNTYNADSSIFICPKGGLYTFGISILTDLNDWMNVRLVVEQTSLVRLLVSTLPDDYNTGSTSTVTECQKGDKVWIRSLSDNTGMWGGSSQPSVFWGFLLHEY